MSLAAFRSKLHLAHYGEKDQVWFPKWLARFAGGKPPTAGLLPVTEALVIEFSRSLLRSGTPAWQRLQGVRAVEAYRDLMMKQILGRLAAAEKDSGAAAGSPEIADQQRLIGVIDPSEPQIMQSMRKELTSDGSCDSFVFAGRPNCKHLERHRSRVF